MNPEVEITNIHKSETQQSTSTATIPIHIKELSQQEKLLEELQKENHTKEVEDLITAEHKKLES